MNPPARAAAEESPATTLNERELNTGGGSAELPEPPMAAITDPTGDTDCEPQIPSAAESPSQKLLTAEVAGFEIRVDTVRYEPAVTEGDLGVIWLLSIAGQATAVRGAWANMVALGSYLRLTESDQLLTLARNGEGWYGPTARLGDPRRLGRTWQQIILLPPCTERWSGVGELLIVEDEIEPAATLMNHLALRSSLPLSGDWKYELWAWAIESGVAKELVGIGRRAWLVRVSDSKLLTECMPKFGSVEAGMIVSDAEPLEAEAKAATDFSEDLVSAPATPDTPADGRSGTTVIARGALPDACAVQ